MSIERSPSDLSDKELADQMQEVMDQLDVLADRPDEAPPDLTANARNIIAKSEALMLELLTRIEIRNRPVMQA
jgi:hypothetical protein